MIETHVVAAGAISALGSGRAAYRSPANAATKLRHDEELARSVARANPGGNSLHASGTKTRPVLVGRVPDEYLTPSTGDRAEDLLRVAARELAVNLERALPDFRSRRVLALVGTSAGGMPSLERALAARERAELTQELAERAGYCAPTRCLGPILGLPELRIWSILAACASSTLAIGLGCRLLESGQYDLVIAGGYDALSPFVVSGFDALGALTRSVPRPFSADRDGMALGEGAALLALALPSSLEQATARASALVGRVWGFGASSDAVHVTAPDPQGLGLSRAALTALADAGLPSSAMEWVSAHATATVLNDAAEAKALVRIFAGETPPISAWKAVIGHTLGAAGGLECLAAWAASSERSLPTPSTALPTLEEASKSSVILQGGPCLKLSAAFGGCNAALVLADAGAERIGPARS
ncbi:MAG TPA: beta-ketoacyl synthase N-terminal-like domain-containing protein, partial [Polyangiaceae bacterium]|nr:beta-ketoacyl synthase N-terminal-like domain-containing protein [Polyangiaceae bacterium]